MRLKIIRFIIITLLTITAIQCQVEAGDTPFLPGSSVTPQFQQYTEAEQQQIRQNLIGRYQGYFNNSLLIFDIIPNNITSSFNNTEITIQYYYIVFPLYSNPLLIFIIDDNSCTFVIDLNFNDLTQVTGFHAITDPSLSFYRIEENSTNPPTETVPLDEYTDEQQQQIRQSLTGRYSNIQNNTITTLEITSNNASITDHQNTINYTYDIVFFSNTQPILTFRTGNTFLQFYIQLNQHYEVTGLHTMLLNPIKHFQKQENHTTINHPNDEL